MKFGGISNELGKVGSGTSIPWILFVFLEEFLIPLGWVGDEALALIPKR